MAEQGVTVWYIGYQNGRASFTDIPINPKNAVRVGEAVITIECRSYDL